MAVRPTELNLRWRRTPEAFHCQSPGFGGLLPPYPGFAASTFANPERVALAGREAAA